MIDKLVDECDENIDEEIKILDKNEDKCNSCIFYIVLFWIFLIINVGIGAYFVYHKLTRILIKKLFLYVIMFIGLKTINMCPKDTSCFATYNMGEIKQISIKNRTYHFYNDIIDLENFDWSLLKIDKKSYKNVGIYNIGYITIK